MPHPYSSRYPYPHFYRYRTAAQNRADALGVSEQELHTIEPAPRFMRAGGWYVVGPRERVGSPHRIDRRVYGTNRKMWLSDIVQLIDDPRFEVEPEDVARWRALIEPRRRGEPDESARHTVRVVLRLSPEHARRLRAMAAGEPLSRTAERLIDGAWDGAT